MDVVEIYVVMKPFFDGSAYDLFNIFVCVS